MTAALFLIFVAAAIIVAVMLLARYMGAATAIRSLTGLSFWFAYVGFIGYSGIARNIAIRPPGIVFIFVPVLGILLFFIARSSSNGRIALAFPLWLLIGMQSFRIGVELFLHRLWLDGLVPKMLTFEGANVDIYIGLSAPLIGWLSARSSTGLKLALMWNVLGLLALANVVVRAVLTAPGPLNLIHTVNPDLMIGNFPFVFIPAFFVPLAVILHTLAMQNMIGRISFLSSSDSLGTFKSSEVINPGS